MQIFESPTCRPTPLSPTDTPERLRAALADVQRRRADANADLAAARRTGDTRAAEEQVFALVAEEAEARVRLRQALGL